MKVTRKEPVDNPVFIELTSKEAELLINYLGRTNLPATKDILGNSKLNAQEVNAILYQLYDGLFNAGVKYARDQGIRVGNTGF